MKQYFTYIFLIGFLLISSCQFTSRSDDLNYSETKLVNVMTDLYLADAALKDLKPELYDSIRSLYRTQIGVIHKVDMLLVEEDLQSLQSNLEAYEIIHTRVQDSIIMINKNSPESKNKKAVKVSK